MAVCGSDAQGSPLRMRREALLANEIDRMYSKDQILEKYLNLIYYGHGAYGIDDAAQTYFNKHAADLDRTDIYTVRRIGPKDRGKDWGDPV